MMAISKSGSSKLEQLKARVGIIEGMKDKIHVIGGGEFKAHIVHDHHIERIKNLEEAETMNRNDILKRIKNLEALLPAEKLACKYGDVRFCSNDEILTISMIEDLEIAAGVHPFCGIPYNDGDDQ